MKKRGLSPVIATVLLIAIVVSIALVIFLWVRGLTEEEVTKFGGENIKLICDKVLFDKQYDNGQIYISNIGDVPIYSFIIDAISGDSHEAKEMKEIDSTWPEPSGLKQGESYSGDISSHTSGATAIKIIPILVGKAQASTKTYVCEESRSIQEISI